MAGPSEINSTAATVDQVLNDVIMGVAVDLVEKAIITEVPWLGLPVIKQAMDLIFRYVAGKVSVSLQELATQGIIEIQVKKEVDSFQKAYLGLQTAVSGGKQDEIDQARTDVDAAFRSLVSWDGVAIPRS